MSKQTERDLIKAGKKRIPKDAKDAYSKYLDGMVEAMTQNPQSFLELSMDEFEEKLRDEFIKHSNMKLKAMDDNIKKEKDIIKRRKLQDGYDNAALLIGESDTFGQFDSYSMNGMLYNWTLWNAFYMSSWVFAKVINRISTDMIRNGWDISITMKEKIELVRDNGRVFRRDTTEDFDHNKFRKIQKGKINDITEAIKWMRLFGGSAICLLDPTIENAEEYAKPLEKIGSEDFQFLVGDRWTGVQTSVEMVEDQSSPDYDTPKYYTITTDGGQTIRFHHTRVARFSNGRAPAIVQRMLMGWGIPEGVRLFGEINKDEKIKGMITSLLSKYNLEIIKTDGMRAYMTGGLSKEMEDQLDSRLEMVNRYRSFNSLVFLDSADDYTRLDGGGVAGLYDIYNSQARYVAGASDLPQVLLYGDQQMGLSGNTFDDLMLYEDTIESKRSETILKPIDKITEWILLAMKADYEDFELEFNKVLPMTEEDKQVLTRAKLDAWRELVDMGIYNPYLVAKEMRDSKNLIVGKEIDKALLDSLYDEYYNKDGLIEEEVDEDENDRSTASGPRTSEAKVPSDALFNPDDTASTSEGGLPFEDLGGEDDE